MVYKPDRSRPDLWRAAEKVRNAQVLPCRNPVIPASQMYVAGELAIGDRIEVSGLAAMITYLFTPLLGVLKRYTATMPI